MTRNAGLFINIFQLCNYNGDNLSSVTAILLIGNIFHKRLFVRKKHVYVLLFTQSDLIVMILFSICEKHYFVVWAKVIN